MALSEPPLPLELPLTAIDDVSLLHALLSYPAVKGLLPVPILAVLAPLIWWFFRDTWRSLDAEAREHALSRQQGGFDRRVAACMLVTAVVLTLQEYYGGRQLYDQLIRPWLASPELKDFVKLETYDELYGYLWWVSARVIGYVLIPLLFWKLCFPQDSLLDMGLRVRGFFSHLWIYGLCLAVVLPAMALVATQPDFGTYYPFYKQSSRSWFDFLAWESAYFLQFFALELFFRGWMLAALRRSLGSGAIFVMALPYCMIHFGKPYLEVHGAIVAGIVLGSLSLRTRSIYAGFLVHITVAFLMDFLALWQRDALPKAFFVGG